MLIDAPCTGSGTWRRRPDAKWRLAPGALETRLKEQAEVLDSGARLVRVGGRLAYVTCSVLRGRKRGARRGLPRRDPGFALGDAAAAFKDVTGEDAPAHTRIEMAGQTGSALRLSPATTGTDGFFVALIERRA